jgi:hypothetical protein
MKVRIARRSILLGVITLGACADGAIPTRVGDAPIIVTGLEIVGPGTVPLGGTAQFSVIAHQSDGSTRDVTNEATWATSDETVLGISPTGMATGRERGEGSISARVRELTATKGNVVVAPAGTFRLSGRVRDAGDPLSGARVEVTAGTGRGLAMTTSNGNYRLYGVAGDIEVRVTGDGYQEQRKTLQVASHATLDFDLILSRPRDEIGGNYTLTVTADPECVNRLPIGAGVRKYAAVLKQEDRRVTVTLEGSKFYAPTAGPPHNSFGGVVETNRIAFELGWFDPYSGPAMPSVLEELTWVELFLAVSGSAVMTVSPAGLSGTLSGAIESLRQAAPGVFFHFGTCRSTGHQFVLSR